MKKKVCLAKICILIFVTLTATHNFAQKQKPASTPNPTRQLVTGNEKKQLALVIGNANYFHAPKLRNPVNDARDITTSLTKLGFTVISGYDLTLAQMEDNLRKFSTQLRAQKGVGLVYYAGHGIQFDGANYLIPIDANIKSETETKYKGLNLGMVLDSLDNAKNGLNIIVLDACRNNPFARSWNRDANTGGGLAQTNAPTGTFIAYATGPGNVAEDGLGKNGTFTAEFLKQMRVPNLKVEEVFKNVRQNVALQTNNKQTPWDSSSLVGDFYFSRDGALPSNKDVSNGDNNPQPPRVDNADKSVSGRSIPSPESIIINYNSNMIEDVIKDGKIYLENEPNNALINSAVGHSLFSKGNISESIPFLEKAIALGNEISLKAFRVKKQAILNDSLKPSVINLTRDKIVVKMGDESSSAKFSQLKEVKFVETQAKNYTAVVIKGDFLYVAKDGKQKIENNKEMIVLAPQAITKTVSSGTMQLTLAFCTGCEVWTKEIIRLINRCRTGEISANIQQSSNSNPVNSPINRTGGPAVVNLPSETYFTFQHEKFNISIPKNWSNTQSNDISFAPTGASEKNGITHGFMTLTFNPKSKNINEAFSEQISALVSANTHLTNQIETKQIKIEKRDALVTELLGTPPDTNRKEYVNVISILLKDKRLLSLIFVCPADELSSYTNTFQAMAASIRIKD